MNDIKATPPWLAAELVAAKETVEAFGLGWESRFGAGASDSSIQRLEREIGISLPVSYRTFLERHDGARLAIVTDDPVDWAYQIDIFPVAKVAAATIEAREQIAGLLSSSSATKALASSLVAFAAYGGSGDLCLLDPARCSAAGEYAVLDAFHEVPGEWVETVIAASFEDWLRRMLESAKTHQQLLEYWLPTPLVEIAPHG